MVSKRWGFCLGTICLLGLLFSSCNLSSLDDPIVVTDVESEFYISPWEDLREEGRHLQFKVVSVEDKDCRNYTIANNFDLHGKNLDVSLYDIEVPDACEEGEAPAKATIDLGTLSAGVYNLSIDLKNTVFNYGRLTLTGDSYFFDLESEDGITFLHKELLRIPNQTIWGYVSYTEEVHRNLAENFISDLSEITSEDNLADGYYGYFQIEDGKAPKDLDGAPTAGDYFTFSFQHTGTIDDLVSLLENHRNTNGEFIEIKIWNTLGQEF